MLGSRRPTPHHPKSIRRGGRYLTHCAAHPIWSPKLYLTPWYFFLILYSRLKSKRAFSIFLDSLDCGTFSRFCTSLYGGARNVPVCFYGFLHFNLSVRVLNPVLNPPPPSFFWGISSRWHLRQHPPSLFILPNPLPLLFLCYIPAIPSTEVP